MLHRIRHQILELELPREAGAVALQRRVSRVFQEQVLPKLDEVFSRIAPEGRHIRIERLELDLGTIGEASWERDFVEKCVAKITEQVAEAAFELDGEHGTETLTVEENALVVFRHFLETGMLPWYAKHLALTELEQIIGKAIMGGNAYWGQELRRVLKQKEEALQRMVWQFSLEFSVKIVEATLGFATEWVQQAIQIHQSQTGQKMTKRKFFVLAAHVLNVDITVLRNTPPEPAWLAQIFFNEAYPDYIPLPSPPPPEPATENRPQANEFESHTESPQDRPQAAPVEAPNRQNIEKPNTIPEHISENRPPSSNSDAQQALEQPRPTAEETPARKKSAHAKTDPTGISVDNAGLVLLAVYLPPFFKKLELNLESTNELHPFRAIHLLHFLATGQEHPEEPLLVLPKILCGLALEASVPQDLDLSNEEKHEANRLLEAVVRNWPVLKNTSPDGLRAGFLRRAGLLSWSESRGSWVLRVERLGQDLLLEKVPWSYSVIKLPWMREMVAVEW